MTLTRRSLITGLTGIIAAPAIVRASSLMPVKAWDDRRVEWLGINDEVAWVELRSPWLINASARQRMRCIVEEVIWYE